MKQNIDEENIQSIDNNNNDIQKELKNIVETILNKINLDKNLIESCSSLILKYLEKDDENGNSDENNLKEKEEILDLKSQLELTRSDSKTSFYEVMNNYIFDTNCNFNPNEKDNNLIDFGKISQISPISNGEIISLTFLELSRKK